MRNQKIIISRRSNLKGDDGYKTFSVRAKEDTVKQLDEIASKTNRYRNELINIFLEFAVANCEIAD